MKKKLSKSNQNNINRYLQAFGLLFKNTCIGIWVNYLILRIHSEYDIVKNTPHGAPRSFEFGDSYRGNVYHSNY